MSKSRKQFRDPPVRGKPARRGVSWRLLFLAIALLLVLSGGFWLAKGWRAPSPPPVPTAGLERGVAALIEEARVGVQASPRSAAAWGKLGTVLMHYEFKPQARLSFAQAERFSPREPRWPYLDAMLLVNREPQAALLKFQAAVECGPDQPDMPRLRLAGMLLERNRLKEAEQHFQTLLQARSGHPVALLGLARIRLAQGRPAEAANFLAGCVENPHSAKNAQILRAQLEARQGHAEAAERIARESDKLPPDRPWPDPYWEQALQYRVDKTGRLEQADALVRGGKLPEAFKILTTLTNDYPADPEAFYQLGWILNQQQKGNQAEQVMREHLRLAPESPKGHAQLAAAFLAQERYLEAVGVLRSALRLAPTWSELHFNLGYACARLGKTDEAIAHFREALRYDPNYLDSYILLADLLSRRGDRDEAVTLLRQALTLNPTDERAKILLRRFGLNP